MSKPAKSVILVVEDDQDIRDSLVAILEQEGYEAWSATNGKEALDLLSSSVSSRISLVLLDLMMPVMSGWDLLSQLSPPRGQMPPILVMSALKYEAKKIMERGLAFLTKPLDLEVLLATIRNHLNPAA